MPDRIIRDELLTSERYWSVSMLAQQLYVHLLLVVDDGARFSGKNFTLRASCFPGRPIEAKELERILSELIDADLVRCYTANGERFVFVPRFRNRRRYVSASKFPNPPQEINDLPPTKSALSQPQVSPESALSQEGLGLGLGLGLERGRGKEVPTALVNSASAADLYRTPDCPFQELKDAYHELCPSLTRVRIDTAMRQKHCRARWVQVCVAEKWGHEAGMNWFRWFFAEVERSDFLTGRVGNKERPWRADLQWLMTAGNFAKVVEGKYDKEKA